MGESSYSPSPAAGGAALCTPSGHGGSSGHGAADAMKFLAAQLLGVGEVEEAGCEPAT